MGALRDEGERQFDPTRIVREGLEAPFAACGRDVVDAQRDSAVPENAHKPVGCVVMASGQGLRFGSQKLLAPIAGTPMLEWTLRCLPPDLVETIVVTRSEEVAALSKRLGIRYVVHDGPLHSDTIRRGLDELMGVRACAFLQGDQPLLSQESMHSMAAEALAHPESIIRLAWRGNPASPIVFPERLFDDLRAIEGDRGGSALFALHPELRQAVRLVEAAAEWELWDVDTRDDLARVEEVLKGKG